MKIASLFLLIVFTIGCSDDACNLDQQTKTYIRQVVSEAVVRGEYIDYLQLEIMKQLVDKQIDDQCRRAEYHKWLEYYAWNYVDK